MEMTYLDDMMYVDGVDMSCLDDMMYIDGDDIP